MESALHAAQSRKRPRSPSSPDDTNDRSVRQRVTEHVQAAADDSSEDEFGPALPPPSGGAGHQDDGAATASSSAGAAAGPEGMGHPTKTRTLEHEATYLDALPSAQLYEHSFMHRDAVLHTLVLSGSDLIVTASACGQVKFWRKQPNGVEFVKLFKAHVGPVICLCASNDGTRVATCGSDKTVKVFDVLTFDICDMARLPYYPCTAVLARSKGASVTVLAVSDRHSPSVWLYNADRVSDPPLGEVKVHNASVLVMAYNAAMDTIISGDAKGMLEYWSTDASRAFGPPPTAVSFEFKLETDLFALAKGRTMPTSIAVDSKGQHFVVTSTDCAIRVFAFARGKLTRVYNDAPSEYEKDAAAYGLEADEMARRLSLEKDIVDARIKSLNEFITPDATSATTPVQSASRFVIPAANAVFDDSGHFLLFPSVLGIKVLNIHTNVARRVLGRVEPDRFLSVALYQGVPKVLSQLALAKDSSAMSLPVSASAEAPKADPTVVCTAYQRNRFFLFSRREPADDAGASRDAFNEPPSREDIKLAEAHAKAVKRATLAASAIIHTTLGDIHVELFRDETPKAVENFCGLSRKNLYNGNIFHRVIKGFMVQTGDYENSDGTGGHSIFEQDFEDEITARRFDRPGLLAMANAGPNTNGSQIFVTCAPCSWLDKKHTIFGVVTKGLDTVRAIENVKVDKEDRPFEDVKIVSVTLR